MGVTSLAGAAAASGDAREALGPLWAELLPSLLLNLSHTHSRVRGAALKAASALVGAGAPGRMVEESVGPAVRPLAGDAAPAVRAALFAALAEWVTPAAGDTAEDGAAGSAGRSAGECRALLPAFLPTLLLGLTDGDEALRSAALSRLEGLGQSYVAGLPSAAVRRWMGEEAAEAAVAAAQGGVDPRRDWPGYDHPFSVRPKYNPHCTSSIHRCGMA